ncbi:MAG: V-type proton ATPase subunit E [Oscillospiraceae bacterium]|nr:V-type proton ATPase subunit E [Oscillospiraceae bacterium]
MNGIEKITARIETDAKAETAEILREAEEKAAAVRAQYEAQAKQEAEEAKKVGIEAARRQAERLESAAQMEAKKQLLAAKQASLNEAFDKAQAKLLALPDDQYAELLAKMAVKAAKTGREEIILNAKDRDRVGPQVVAKANVLLAEAVKPQPAGKAAKGGKAGAVLSAVVTGANALLQGTAMLTLSQETREMAGGLMLRDGNVEVNCAFETQLRVLREEMAAEIAGILFS